MRYVLVAEKDLDSAGSWIDGRQGYVFQEPQFMIVSS